MNVKAIGELNRKMGEQAEAERGIKAYLIEERVIKGTGTTQIFLLSAGPNSKPHGYRVVITPEEIGNYNPEPIITDYIEDATTQIGDKMFARALDDYFKENDCGIEFKYNQSYL